MVNALFVFLGGGLGALLRYFAGSICYMIRIPNHYSTFFVNIIGCFLLGILYIYFLEKINIPEYTKLALTTGFCGGLTTFSTFSVEIMDMIKMQRFTSAALYIIISLFVGVIAAFLGGFCAKNL